MHETNLDLSKLDKKTQDHITTLLENPASLDGLDVSILFLSLDSFLFSDVLEELVEKYKTANEGKLPSLDLIFISDDLGNTNESKRGKLRMLKALFDDKSRYGIREIVVKSKDRAIVDLEQNVFSSGVKFKLDESL